MKSRFGGEVTGSILQSMARRTFIKGKPLSNKRKLFAPCGTRLLGPLVGIWPSTYGAGILATRLQETMGTMGGGHLLKFS